MNLAEVQELGRKLLTEGMADPPKFGAKVAEFFSIAFSKFDSLEPDAQAYVDDLSEKFVGIIEGGLSKQPDSPHKRALARQVAATRGKHFTTSGLLKPLSAPPELKDEVITEA